MGAPSSTNHSFLLTLSYAILLAFSLFLAYRFLATVAMVALTIMVGLLLAMVLCDVSVRSAAILKRFVQPLYSQGREVDYLARRRIL